MEVDQKQKMRWVLFWTLLVLFALTALLTVFALFFGLGHLDPKDKDKLMTSFILEVGAAIIALFYSLFGLKPPNKPEELQDETNLATVPTKSVQGVAVVEDAPLDVPVDLSRPVADKQNLLNPAGGGLQQYTSVHAFEKHFELSTIIFGARGSFTEFLPNIVVTLEHNPLPSLNVTLADYVENVHTTTRQMLNIKGERQVRAGYDQALQWYSIEMPAPSEEDPQRTLELLQFHKFVVTTDTLATLAVTYPTHGTDPDLILVMHQLLSQFGVKQDAGEDAVLTAL